MVKGGTRAGGEGQLDSMWHKEKVGEGGWDVSEQFREE